MAKYKLSNKAVEDLSKIWEYTFEIWNENQADKYYEILISFVKKLQKTPNQEKIMRALPLIF